MRSSSRPVILAILLTLTALSSAAQTPPAFTVEEMLKLDRLSDPQLSPDGRSVVYVVTHVSLDANARSNHLWMVPTSGGKPVAIARSERSEDTPRWSPDGKTLAFVSTREGGPQVWLVPMSPTGAAGRPRKLTTLGAGASGIAWSPDGKWIAFASEVFPECTTVECNERRWKEAGERASKARVFDTLMFRHWTSWKEGRFDHLFIVPADGSAPPRDVTPGRFDVPPFSLGGPADYAFSPDSRELAFVRKTDPVEAVSTNTDIFLLDVRTPDAEARKITSSPGADSGPAYSPDGRYIAYRAQRRAGFESDRWQLMLYDRKTGEHRSATEGWDRSVESYAWAPDSRSLVVTAQERGVVGLFRIDAAGAGAVALPVEGSVGDVQVARDGRTLVFTRNSLHEPSDIYLANADGTAVHPLTNINPVLAGFKLRPAESVTFEGEGGTPVQSWIVKPADFVEGRRYPLLVLVHGGPQGAWNNSWSYRWNPQVFAAAGFVVFMPNPRGSTGFGQQFTDEISGDWGGKVYEDLMKGVDFAEGLPYVEKGRTGAAGASFGGYMVNWFLGHTTRFRALVSHAGVYNLTSMWGVTEELWFPEWDLKGTPWTNPEGYSKFSPHMYAKSFATPTLVTHGELDFRVPIGEGLQLFTTLQRLEVPSRMVYFPDEGHWINRPANSALWYREFLAWMDKWVKQDGK